jgi:hypothetical protein
LKVSAKALLFFIVQIIYNDFISSFIPKVRKYVNGGDSMAIDYNLPPDPTNAVLKRIYPWDEYNINLVMNWLYI